MRNLLLALLAWAATSCIGFTEGRDLALVLTVEPTQVARTDSVEVTLLVINRSTHSVSATSPDAYGACVHAFQVVSDSNREVAVPTLLCAQIAFPPLELLPGDSVTVVDYWKPGVSTLDGQPLPAGDYRLAGLYHAAGEVLFSAMVGIRLID